MSIERERAPFYRAHTAWAAADLDGFMVHIAEDILYIVNVDGLQVPYALSAVGKEDVRQRLQILLDTFFIEKFAIEILVHEEDYSRSIVHGIYRHKSTNEYLDIKLRFRGWVKNGLITRLEEYHDAAYIEAFERFVHYMQSAAEKRGPRGPGGSPRNPNKKTDV